MIWIGIIKPANQMEEAEIDRLYEMHEVVYYKKGIGHIYATWRENLGKLYHNGPGKNVNMFSRNGKTIDGYIIFTDSLTFNDSEVSKMIESTTAPVNEHRLRKENFFRLYGEFLNERREIPFYMAEIGTKYRNIHSIMNKVGFFRIGDEEMAESLMSRFLGDVDFSLKHDGKGLVINRKTAVTDNYEGYIFTNMKL